MHVPCYAPLLVHGDEAIIVSTRTRIHTFVSVNKYFELD